MAPPLIDSRKNLGRMSIGTPCLAKLASRAIRLHSCIRYASRLFHVKPLSADQLPNESDRSEPSQGVAREMTDVPGEEGSVVGFLSFNNGFKLARAKP